MPEPLTQQTIDAVVDVFKRLEDDDVGSESAIIVTSMLVRAIREHPPWQPIETAPRDGSWFLICRDVDGEDSVEVGRYSPLMRYEYDDLGGDTFRRREVISYEWAGFNNFHRATHWMPLSKPPPLRP